MSWGYNSVCWNCVKNELCTCKKTFEKAVLEANQVQGHLGGGSIVLSCFKHDIKKEEVK